VKVSIAYKNCLIRGESFQREKNGKWIAQYNCARQNNGGKGHDFPSQQIQLDKVFSTEDEADNFALKKAMERIDNN